MIVKIDDAVLVMYKKVDMKESSYDKDKKEYVKTGGTVEKTEYTFRDSFGDVLVFLAGNEYRDYEGKGVILNLDLKRDDFKKQNKISLKSVLLA